MKMVRYKKHKEKGFSLPSIIIGSIIATILSGVAISSMWSSVDDSKVVTISSLMKEQLVFFEANPDYDFDALNEDNDQDYLPELIDAGLITKIPLELFEEPSSLTWEIRKTVTDGYKDLYYSYITSTNEKDKILIKRSLEKLNLSGTRIIVN